MSIADHRAILLHSSLDQARQNKVNKNKVEFYVNVAFPPTATADLASAMKEVAPNGNLNGLRLTIEANGKKAKPHPGIPNDWLIVRMSSGPDYPPELFTAAGEKIAALPLNGQQIRTEFYSGQFVRINGYPFLWNHSESGARGISWNLSGVMSAGGGERRAASAGGESSESAFAKYRNDAPAQTGTGAATSGGDAFGGSGAPANNAGANGSNPFSQPSSGGPFG